MRLLAVSALFLTAASVSDAAQPDAEGERGLPSGFVYVAGVIPDAVLDIRYYGTDNFVGARIDSYDAPTAILSVEAANALKRAAAILREKGYKIKIYDAYRPVSAVAHFVRWARDKSDTGQKKIFYPEIDKADLFKKGYIATRSGHSRGSTVDLSIVDYRTGEDVDMGSPFDFFGPISSPSSGLVTPEQRKNRGILRNAMESSGFKPLSTEWWHFTLKDEPYPGTYFDFPVK